MTRCEGLAPGGIHSPVDVEFARHQKLDGGFPGDGSGALSATRLVDDLQKPLRRLRANRNNAQSHLHTEAGTVETETP